MSGSGAQRSSRSRWSSRLRSRMNHPGFCRGSTLFERMELWKKQPKYSREVIERAVRMVSEAGSQYESQ